jgi:hypothetical protein|eukprot:Transcript_14299.p2 GENE.Transcript_14299~~Transcript_14299.p2  ORF type:complete len:181 (+),score=25.19 Transcript_14299:381-923(+)
MSLKVITARNASTPQTAGAMKSTAQKKLLSVGWMKRWSCGVPGAAARRRREGRAAAVWGAWPLRHLKALESPVVLAGLVHVVPPPQPDQQPARDVFDRPEVHGREDGHDDKGQHVPAARRRSGAFRQRGAAGSPGVRAHEPLKKSDEKMYIRRASACKGGVDIRLRHLAEAWLRGRPRAP